MAITYGNRVAVQTSTTGTGTITLGSVVSAAYLTFSEAGIGDGATVHYLISEGSDFEIGQGTYTASGTTLSRDTVYNSKISGTAGTTKMTLGGGAEVRVIASAAALAAGDNSWRLINETVVSVDTAAVEWTSIANNYVELWVEWIDAQHDSAGSDFINFQMSHDNGSNYSSSAALPLNTASSSSTDYSTGFVYITKRENTSLLLYSADNNASTFSTLTATAPVEIYSSNINSSFFGVKDGELIDAIKLTCYSAANIAAGTFRLWGR